MWLTLLLFACSAAGPLRLRGEVDAPGPLVVEVRTVDKSMDVLATTATDGSGRFELEVPAPADGSLVMVAVVAWSDGEGDGLRGPADRPVGVLVDQVLFHASAAEQTMHGFPVDADVGWNVARPPTPGRVEGKAVKGVLDIVVPSNVALREPAVRTLPVRVRGGAWSCIGVEAPKFEGGRGAGSGLVASTPLGSDGRAVLELPEEPPWEGAMFTSVEMTYGRLVAWESESCDRYDPIEDVNETWRTLFVVYARATEPDALWLSVYPYSSSPNRWGLQGDGVPRMGAELVLDAR